jgi:hypothetical protein
VKSGTQLGTMTITNETKNEKMEVSRDILLSLPQCDMERPDSGGSKIGSAVGVGNSTNKNKSVKTTAKRADLVLFELPKFEKGTSRKDLLAGRCKILGNGRCASLVTPSTSLQLVTVGSSNALVVWNKDNASNGTNDTNYASSDHDNPGKESPTKRRKFASTTPATVTPCRLIQPGGSGSSFLVGQPRDFDPMELSHFFATLQLPSSDGDATVTNSISTHELCKLFQVAPKQIWDAMLWIPSVVSYEDVNSNGKEMWMSVPEEEVLFGQRALVETLCEEDDVSKYDEGDDKNLGDETIESMAVKVRRRLLPLLLETTSSDTRNGVSDKESRSLAIARKTVLLSSSSSYSTKIKNKQLNDVSSTFRPDASRIAFYALRDLFLKYPSYAWSDLSAQWSTRVPLGERYERITSTTEWIEDEKMGGHGGLVPDQLVFSSSSPAFGGKGGIGENNSSSSNITNDENHPDNGKTKKNDFFNSKAVLSLVDPQTVLAWRVGKK